VHILSADQIREWDRYTIAYEPISSIDLMERAATRCVEWLETRNWQDRHFKIFCGKGNNGGDGLAIARLLMNRGYGVSIFILESGRPGSPDFQGNLQRLHELPRTDLHYLQQPEHFPTIRFNEIVIDALFGSGLSKPLEGLPAALVEHINRAIAPVISIDLPSGLFIDRSSADGPVICADHTLTFQCWKMGLLMQENASFIGEVEVLDIGLHPDFPHGLTTRELWLDNALARTLYRPRNRFSHKGSFGHALIIGGSYGKMGAAVLAVKACLRSGAGLTTALVPGCGYTIMQATLPEAMTLTGTEADYLSTLPDGVEKYSAVGIGPGLGTLEATQKMVSFIIRRYTKPLVIDADGLNCLAQQKELLQHLPPFSILTPHPKEFERLFGPHKSDFDRIRTAREKAKELNIIIVLKSHHSFIALPGGMGYFNSTGNAGMAKGGSGDILTGIITALAAQGYDPAQAALLGVYLHGLSGDLAARDLSMESMLPSDMIERLGEAFRTLVNH
jgi:NAD(P)H-hydrate epimerase